MNIERMNLLNLKTLKAMKAQILTKYEIVKKTEKALLISTPMIVGKKELKIESFGCQNRK